MERKQSYYLVNQREYYIGWIDGPGSGWNYDNRGARKMATDRGPYPISNVDGKFPTGLIREMQEAKCGVFTLETFADFNEGFDGFTLSLYDADENNMLMFYTKKGSFCCIGGDEKEVVLKECENKQGRHYFRFILDLDERTITYYVDSVWCAVLPTLTKSFKFFKIGTLEGNILDVVPGYLDIYANYIQNDSFILTPDGEFPYDWEKNGYAFVEKDELNLDSTGSNTTIMKSFDKADGRLLFETYFYTPENKGKTSLNLLCDGNKAITLTFDNGKLFANGTELRGLLYNMWYRFRIEIDCAKGKAKLHVNSKEPYEISLADKSKHIDAVAFSAENGAKLKIDDVKLWDDITYPDYCPKPVPPKGYGDYHIGMNMCSLWHTSSHVGWDCITPFAETKPLMGYYDEGLPEVADWEIKFMVEHGIGIQFYCWYTDGSQRNAPLKRTRLCDALIDGYLNAKYSDMMQFGLLWEANGGRPESSEAFRKNFVPYWIENFFSDKRYARIDNKAVMGVFAPNRLIDEFGSPKALKAEFDYLRAEVSKLGYDGMVIFCSATPDERLKEAGFDACYAYNWGTMGCYLEYTKSRLESMRNLDSIMHFIPTASTGFNRISWGSDRSPCMTADDFRKLNKHIKDYILPTFKDKPDWTHKFVMLSNWNEFGEGTYINPSGLNGFGYVDAVRDVYTQGGEHTDIKPDANQLSRLSYLYPQTRKTLRPLQHRKVKEEKVEYKKSLVSKVLDFKQGSWITEQLDNPVTVGMVSGTSNGNDAKMKYTKSLHVPCKKATYARVKLTTDKVSDAVIFFRTDKHPEWSGRNAAGFIAKPDKTEYIVRLANGRKNNTVFEGNLISLRIDPSSVTGVTSTLTSVELFSPEPVPETNQLFINGESILLDNPLVRENGHIFVPIFPERMLLYRLNSFYKWNPTKKQLSLFANHASVVYTMNSRKCVINGEVYTLDTVPYLDDGLPMIPIDTVCRVFGYKLTEKDDNVYIKTPFDK